jgi:predicted ATPase
MRGRLPQGTVTFLFSDIQGSTHLLSELGDTRYSEVLQEHREVLGQVWAKHCGVVVDTAGDAFFVAFARAHDACVAALAAQVAMESTPLAIRIGVHTGEPLVADGRYVGIDVHRAARISAAAYGGQVVVSQTTRELAGLPARDLGEHRLKDLAAPERLYQVSSGNFPPLRSLYQTNLPVQVTPLVGRDQELADIGRLFDSRARLVTLTGPGGVGKTRVALQAAADLADRFRDGVWFVPLADIERADAVAPAVCTVLGVTLDELQSRELLLVLDNFEHVLEAAEFVTNVLTGAPDVVILATSRERLAVDGEQRYPVEPLPLDDGIELFLDRARRASPAFDHGGAAAAIVRRLDGLPLALELAAARAPILSGSELERRLELQLLTGRGAGHRRHRALRATLQWSYDLLSDDERKLFGALGVFAGSFDIEAAEAVCAADVNTLQSLVEKSLVQLHEDRLSFLRPVREFALGLTLVDSVIRRGHAEHYLARAEHHDAVTPRSERPAVLAQLAPDVDNFRAAFAWADEGGDHLLTVRLATIAGWYGIHSIEWDRFCRRAVVISSTATPGPRIALLLRATYVAKEIGDIVRAHELYDDLLECARGAGDERAQRAARGGLGDLALRQGNPVGALRHYAAALSGAADDERAALAHAIAEAYMAAGDLTTAAAAFEQALTAAEDLGDSRLAGKVLHGLGDLRLRHSDLPGAADAYRRSIMKARAHRDPKSAVYCLAGLAAVAIRSGDRARAARLWSGVELGAEEHPLDADYRAFYLGERTIGTTPEPIASLDEAFDFALSLD